MTQTGFSLNKADTESIFHIRKVSFCDTYAMIRSLYFTFVKSVFVGPML